MSRNRKFKNQYLITVEGITTNGFMAKLTDDYIKTFTQAITLNHQQVKVGVEVVSSVGDYKAKSEQSEESEQ